MFYLPGEGQGLIDGCDFVADAVDTVAAKLALAEECRDKGIPLVSAIRGNKLIPAAFRGGHTRTPASALCRSHAAELKKRGIAHLPVVFSDEPPSTGPTEYSGGDAPREGKHASSRQPVLRTGGGRPGAGGLYSPAAGRD